MTPVQSHRENPRLALTCRICEGIWRANAELVILSMAHDFLSSPKVSYLSETCSGEVAWALGGCKLIMDVTELTDFHFCNVASLAPKSWQRS